MKKIRLKNLPSGSLFKFGNTYGLKTEYRTEQGAIESFIIGSGEFFWGGTSKAIEQSELLVEKIQFIPPDL